MTGKPLGVTQQASLSDLTEGRMTGYGDSSDSIGKNVFNYSLKNDIVRMELCHVKLNDITQLDFKVNQRARTCFKSILLKWFFVKLYEDSNNYEMVWNSIPS